MLGQRLAIVGALSALTLISGCSKAEESADYGSATAGGTLGQEMKAASGPLSGDRKSVV